MINQLKSTFVIALLIICNCANAQLVKDCKDFKNIEVLSNNKKNLKSIFNEDYQIEYTSHDGLGYIKSKVTYNETNPCNILLEVVDFSDKSFPYPIGEKMMIELKEIKGDTINYVAKVREFKRNGMFIVLNKIDK